MSNIAVKEAIELATAAMEEAAKVADASARAWISQCNDTKDQFAKEICRVGIETSESIATAIRSLKSTVNKGLSMVANARGNNG